MSRRKIDVAISAEGPDNRGSVCEETENDNPLPVPCHGLVSVKHWFFRYYIVIAAVLLACGLSAAWSIKTEAPWKVAASVVGGVFSLGYFIQKQKLEELKLFKEIFAEFNKTYDSLNNELNRIADEESPVSDKDRDTLFKYFNLCGEEYLYYRLGYIYPEVWRAWYNGMQFFYKKEPIKQEWEKELATNSYYGLQLKRSPHGVSACRCFCPHEQGDGGVPHPDATTLRTAETTNA